MTIGRGAAFYEAAGYGIVRSASTSWYKSSAGVYRALPDARLVDPPEEELRALLVSKRLLALQYGSPRSRGLPIHAYWVRDKAYGEQSLHRTFLQGLGRARADCDAREISFDDLHRFGMAVNTDVRARRAWVDPHLLDAHLWRRFCDAGNGSQGVVAFGCFTSTAMTSWMVGVIEARAVYGLHMMSRADLRPLRPNNLLYFEFTRAMLARDDVDAVNTGLEPIRPAGQMDRFKRHGGYAKEPCGFATVLHPLAGTVLLNGASTRLLDLGRNLGGADSRIGRLQALAELARATSTPEGRE